MQSIEAMSSANPQHATANTTVLNRCIEATAECALTCIACADACLGESEVDSLRACIRLNLDCADICNATACLLSRQYSPAQNVQRSLLEACIQASTACGEECSRHASQHDHCRICAEQCERCAQACRDLGSAIGEAAH